MLDHDVGVSTSTRYEIKNVDEDYFGDPDLDDEEPSGTS
jgi:restriction endonuclease Mrr